MHALDSSGHIELNILSSSNTPTWLRPKKKIMCFEQPDPTYRNRPTLDFFLQKYRFFFVGVFIIEV